MVNKRTPFIPVTFIVVGVAVVLGMNARLHPVAPAESPPPVANNPGRVNEVITPASKTPKQNSATPVDNDPMLTAKPAKFKPIENPTSAHQQWFRQ